MCLETTRLSEGDRHEGPRQAPLQHQASRTGRATGTDAVGAVGREEGAGQAARGLGDSFEGDEDVVKLVVMVTTHDLHGEFCGM